MQKTNEQVAELAADPPRSALVPGRESVVRERLYDLLSTLGELPLGTDRPRAWAGSFSRSLSSLMPSSYVVLNGAYLAERAIFIENLAVGPAGAVVLGHTDERPAGVPLRAISGQRMVSWRARSAQSAATGRSGASGPLGPVRETLRCAFALRAWLRGTIWQGVPVLAAVCSPPVPGYRSQPALLLDGLWVGTIDQLVPWLEGADELGQEGAALLAGFLAERLGTSD